LWAGFAEVRGLDSVSGSPLIVLGGRTVERVADLMDEWPKQFAGSVHSGKDA
jgi:hypothetical protein